MNTASAPPIEFSGPAVAEDRQGRAIASRLTGGRLAEAIAAPQLFVAAVIQRDWRSLATTVFSCVVATTVATFQYSVYNSFIAASAVIPRVVEADYWVSAESVTAFDFPTPISEDYAASLAALFPQGETRRVTFGFVPWRSPAGKRSNVALVGIDGWRVNGSPLPPNGFVANEADLARLDIAGRKGLVEASIGTETLAFAGAIDSMSTYVGAPYVIADFATARRIIGGDPTGTAFLVGTFGGPPPTDWEGTVRDFGARHPDIRLHSRAEFEASSSNYWLTRTGAGLAIGLAAILAALLMVILLANGVLRFIQRYYPDLLSLLGHGATRNEIATVVAGIALATSAVTLAVAAVTTPALVLVFQPILPWVHFTLTDLLVPLGAAATAFIAAMLAARGAILGFAPDAVFRS